MYTLYILYIEFIYDICEIIHENISSNDMHKFPFFFIHNPEEYNSQIAISNWNRSSIIEIDLKFTKLSYNKRNRKFVKSLSMVMMLYHAFLSSWLIVCPKEVFPMIRLLFLSHPSSNEPPMSVYLMSHFIEQAHLESRKKSNPFAKMAKPL